MLPKRTGLSALAGATEPGIDSNPDISKRARQARPNRLPSSHRPAVQFRPRPPLSKAMDANDR
jgi:hypothetical protein